MAQRYAAASKLRARRGTFFYDSALLILLGRENMTSTIAILLSAWLGLNAAFVALRLYITADRASNAKQDSEARFYPIPEAAQLADQRD
jgi:hypothetical protein